MSLAYYLQLTYADVSFYHHISMIPNYTGLDVQWETCPKLQSLRDRVGQHPQILAWIAKRPDSNI